MIARLTGEIVGEEPDGTLTLDVSGVGYEVLAPLGTVGRLRAHGGAPFTLHVHTHVREDTLSLFGFATADDRAAFRTLLTVSSVGPKIAIAILSSLPAHELARVIARRELGRLTAISGIGKKTAERILLELRDKLPEAPGPSRAGEAKAGAPSAPLATPAARELLVGALTRMGYKPAEAERAAEQVAEQLPEAALPELVREALRVLAK